MGHSFRDALSIKKGKMLCDKQQLCFEAQNMIFTNLQLCPATAPGSTEDGCSDSHCFDDDTGAISSDEEALLEHLLDNDTVMTLGESYSLEDDVKMTPLAVDSTGWKITIN